MGDTREDWVTPWNEPSCHFKNCLQLKTKERCCGWGEGQLWEVVRRSLVDESMNIYVWARPLMRSVSHLPLPGTQSETLTNGNFPCKYNVSYKRVTFTQFSEFLMCLSFLKNNQFKVILCQRGVFGEASALLFRFFLSGNTRQKS